VRPGTGMTIVKRPIQVITQMHRFLLAQND
jgi:hypothetical protein